MDIGESRIHFSNGVDRSEHRRSGNVRREPRLSKNNLLARSGSAECLRYFLTVHPQLRAADIIKIPFKFSISKFQKYSPGAAGAEVKANRKQIFLHTGIQQAHKYSLSGKQIKPEQARGKGAHIIVKPLQRPAEFNLCQR